MFLDGHHHFIDTASNGSTFQSFLGKLIPNTVYLPEDYSHDVIDPLEKAGVKFCGSIHLEAIPSDGLAEAQWVSRLVETTPSCRVKAIVASCNLAANDIEDQLETLTDPALFSVHTPVKGIRWILDCVGKFNGHDATHVATTRHDGVDYLRGGGGEIETDDGSDTLRYDGGVVPEFERGFSMLEKYNLTFDLQCAPAQLLAASALCARYPNVKVVIDHLGKPRNLLGGDMDKEDTNAMNRNLEMNLEELTVWRQGMNRMAANSNVYVKISMLGYAIPGWTRSKERIGLMKSLVQETVKLFGPRRCFVCTNFWKNSVVSDNDGLAETGPDPVQYLELIYGFLKEDYSEEDLDHLFCRTAANFYGLDV